MKSVEEGVPGVIAICLGISRDEVKPESRFIEDLSCDSLDRIELAMALEEEFETEIPDEEVEKFVTVGQVVDYLKTKVH